MTKKAAVPYERVRVCEYLLLEIQIVRNREQGEELSANKYIAIVVTAMTKERKLQLH